MKWLQRQYHSYRPSPPKKTIDTQKFDENTGQIYNETTVAIRTDHDRGWDRASRVVLGPSFRDTADSDGYLRNWRAVEDSRDLKDYRNHLDSVKSSKVRGLRGTRSLQDAAIECILQNISDITLEGIRCLPVHIVRQLWHTVNMRCTVCFNTWKIFATILCREPNIPNTELLHFCHSIPNPISPLPTYTTPLISNAFEFLTSLSVTTPFPVPDLCAISSIKNLCVLEIINTSYANRMDVSDRVVRAWQLAALEEGAFQLLRIMKLWGYDEVTQHSLAFLNSFPALALFEIGNCGVDTGAELRARQIGWKTIRARESLQFLDELCSKRISSIKSNNGDQKYVGAVYAQPLGDASGIRSMPRSEVSKFLTQKESPTDGGPSVKLGLESMEPKVVKIDDDLLRTRKRIKHQTTRDKRSQAESPETWDFRTYTSFSRIGELREDLDLAKAGVFMGEQVAVANQLVNSVPLVSLCVGPTQPITSRLNLDALVFLRIKGSDTKEVKRKERPPSASRSTQTGLPSKESRHNVNKIKKRNLDDLLGSFMQ